MYHLKKSWIIFLFNLKVGEEGIGGQDQEQGEDGEKQQEEDVVGQKQTEGQGMELWGSHGDTTHSQDDGWIPPTSKMIHSTPKMMDGSGAENNVSYDERGVREI